MTLATIVRTLADHAEVSPSDAHASDWIELRADLAGDLECGGLYTLRGVSAGRRERLLRAAQRFDRVDLEPGDLDDAGLLAAIEPHRRVITWRGNACDLDAVLATISRVPAALYRIEVLATSMAEALLAPGLLKRAGRRDLTAYALGPTGFWTRILAPHLGAPIVFAGSIEDMPTVAQCVDDYSFPEVGGVEQIFGIVGHPVLRSLSPRLHNAAFRALGRRALYLPFDAPDFAGFWSALIEERGLESLGFAVRALTVVSPHKEVALAAASATTPAVDRAQSTNLFTNHDGLWTADTTDPAGVLLSLGRRGIELRDRRVAVVGCGGSGRAAAAALQQAGADVTLVNRGLERAIFAQELLALPFEPLATFSAAGYSIVINATPVGAGAGELPFDVANLAGDAVVIDFVYGVRPTALVSATRAGGQTTIDGREVLRTQVMRQFQVMTGEAMPDDVPRRILGLELGEELMMAADA